MLLRRVVTSLIKQYNITSNVETAFVYLSKRSVAFNARQVLTVHCSTIAGHLMTGNATKQNYRKLPFNGGFSQFQP